MQVVFQDPFASLSPRMTIEQIVGEWLEVHEPLLGHEQRRECIVAVLTEVGLLGGTSDDLLVRYPHECSGGQRQRIAIARAAIMNPDVLVLDEPTAGLDPKQIIETRQLIHELAGDHTIILSTHILPEVAQTCQRVVINNKGKVVAVDTPDNLTRQLRGAETMFVLVDGGDAAPLLLDVAGVTRVAAADRHGSAVGYEVESIRGEDVRRELARAVVSQGLGLLELRPLRMSLEEVFLQVTTEEEAGRVEPAEEATA